jgi:zinc protease
MSFNLGDQMGASVNGLDVVLTRKETSAKTFSAYLYVRAGASYEPPEQAGISHLLEHSVFLGTKQNPTREKVETSLLSLGGAYNAHTGMDSTVFQVEGVESTIEKGISLLCDFAYALLDDDKELMREKKVVKAEIEQDITPDGKWMDPALVASEVFYPNSPLAQPILGTKKTLRNISKEMLQHYHKTHYGVGNMCLAVVSTLPEHEMLERLKRCLPEMPTAEKRLPYPLAAYSEPLKAIRCIDAKNFAVEVNIFFGMPTPKTAKEAIAYLLMDAVLFHSEMSAIYGTARKKGLVYTSYGGLFSTLGHTAYNVATHIAGDKIPRFYDHMRLQIKRVLKEGIDAAFFQDCKNYFEYRRYMMSERPTYLMDTKVRREFLEDKVVWLPEEEMAALPLVSRDDVLAAIRQVFSSDRVVTVLKGNGMTKEMERRFEV